MTNTTAGKVALVTGASSGIGEATALELARAGYTVYAAARRVERINHLTESGIRPISMDVTDDSSMHVGVEKIVAYTGRIDVLVNNAGYGSYGALEDVPMDEARYQFEVNVFGAARLTQLVLPHMRENRSGKIVNITSMGGKIHTPLGTWYHATKFALEAISDCLRLELKPFGIDVIVIEPGGIRSEWGRHRRRQSPRRFQRRPVCAPGQRRRQLALVESSQRRSSPPELIARTITKALQAGKPQTRYAVGFGAKPMIFLHEVLPDRTFDVVMRRVTGVPSNLPPTPPTPRWRLFDTVGLPPVPMEARSVARRSRAPDGTEFRPSMLVTLTLGLVPPGGAGEAGPAGGWCGDAGASGSLRLAAGSGRGVALSEAGGSWPSFDDDRVVYEEQTPTTCCRAGIRRSRRMSTLAPGWCSRRGSRRSTSSTRDTDEKLGAAVASSLSLAMDLTTIWICPPKCTPVQTSYFKENWTFGTSSDTLPMSGGKDRTWRERAHRCARRRSST